MGDSAKDLIEQLRLQPHPEGGWYRETWRAEPDASGRSRGTAILFLLQTGEASHWHRVDAHELWLWQRGDPLHLKTFVGDSAPVDTIILGCDTATGHELQGHVPEGVWQAASTGNAAHGYSLVSCVVVPGFDFAGFEMAPAGWEPEK